MSSVTCRRCGRELRRKASIEAGIGMVCAAKEGCRVDEPDLEAPTVALADLLREAPDAAPDDGIDAYPSLDELVRARVDELGAFVFYRACVERRRVPVAGDRLASVPERRVYVVSEDRPRLLRHVVMHSPTGMAWGYGGSGPADCALSILAHALDDPRAAITLHQSYKREVVGIWDVDGAEVSLTSVLVWSYRELERRRAA